MRTHSRGPRPSRSLVRGLLLPVLLVLVALGSRPQVLGRLLDGLPPGIAAGRLGQLQTATQVQAAFARAAAVGTYRYETTVLETTRPAPTLANAGRRTSTRRIQVTGELSRPDKTMDMHLKLGAGTSSQALEVRAEDGKMRGRLEGDEHWTDVGDLGTDLFAPGGDPMAFLQAATNILPAEGEVDPIEAAALGTKVDVGRLSRYTFDLDGKAFATYMRDQLEEELRRDNALPDGVTLDLAREFTDMTGRGELWVDAGGYPVHQSVDLSYPAGDGANDAVELKVVTVYRGWPSSASGAVGARLNGATGDIARAVASSAGGFSRHAGQLSMLALLAALGAFMVRFRRSPLGYKVMVAAVLAGTLGGPLIQASKVHAATARLKDHIQREQARAEAAAQSPEDAATAALRGEPFDPLADPLAGYEHAAVPAQARIRQLSGGHTGSDQLVTAQDVCDPNAAGLDCDGDGLDNQVEITALGTDPELADTDGDGISDGAEVRGFTLGVHHWYLDPLNVDSNGDNLPDGVECLALVDVDDTGALGTPAGTACANTDTDSTPDVFDFDNDGDGVPDAVDSSPNYAAPVSLVAQQNHSLQLAGYTIDEPLVADLQIRPENPDHLWLTNNVYDWPTGDELGQIKRITDTTFADFAMTTTDPQADDGDLMTTPLLEVRLPDPATNSDQPSGGLPVKSTFTGDVASAPLDDWLDTDALDAYGVTVSQDTDGSLLAYVQLSLVLDTVGDTPVAWGAQIPYRPTSSTWGGADELKLLWLVSGLTDSCNLDDLPDGEDPNDYCADHSNWTTEKTLITSYEVPFTLTGLTVREDLGTQTALVLENDARSPTAGYEAPLWQLARGLETTWFNGQLLDTDNDGAGDRRFAVGDIARFDASSTLADGDIARWGIPKDALAVRTFNYSDAVTGFTSLNDTEIPDFLAATLGDAATDHPVTMLVALEASTRSTILEDTDTVSVAGNAVSVNLSAVPVLVTASLTRTPFERDGAGWTAADLETALTALDDGLQTVLDPAVVGAEFGSIDSGYEGVVLAGVRSLAQGLYASGNRSVSQAVASAGVPASDTIVDDGALALDGDPTNDPTEIMVAALEGPVLMLAGLLGDQRAVTVDADLVASTPASDLSDPVQLLATLGYEFAPELASDQVGQAIRAGKGAMKAGSKWVIKKVVNALQGKGTFKNPFKSTTIKVTNYVIVAACIAAVAITVVLVIADVVPKSVAEYTVLAAKTVKAAFSVIDYAVRTARFNALTSAAASGAVSPYKVIEQVAMAERYATYSAIIGLVVQGLVTVALFTYTLLSQHIGPHSLTFDALLAQAIATLIVAILFAIIAAIPIIGALILAVVGAIDAIIALVCKAVGVKQGGTVDRWVCGGISGALTTAFTYVIGDQWVVVSTQDKKRLDIALEPPVPIENGVTPGFVVGNALDVTADITTSIKLAATTGLGSKSDKYLTAFFKGESRARRDLLKKAAFNYTLETKKRNHHGGLSPGDTTWVDDPADASRIMTTTTTSGVITYTTPGINVEHEFFLSEGMYLPALSCWGLLIQGCYRKDVQTTSHMPLGQSFVFDVLPATFDEFVQTVSIPDSHGGYRFAWSDAFPPQPDADGDGLRSAAVGGPDPDDSRWDTDGDGLSDYWEVQNGSDPLEADGDGDGLSDYWELVYDADPYAADADSDGLPDGEEVFHTNAPPYGPDNSIWTGGWETAYTYSADGSPVTTQVTSDPLRPDTDFDTITDYREKIYRYNPRVPSVLNVMSLDADIDSAVAPGDGIDYLAKVTNQLDLVYLRGLLQSEFPVDTVRSTSVMNLLPPRSSVQLSGTVATDGSLSATESATMTLRAGAVAEADQGRLFLFRFSEPSSSTTWADSSVNGYTASCAGGVLPCPSSNGSYLTVEDDDADVVVAPDQRLQNRTAFSGGALLRPATGGIFDYLLRQPDRFELGVKSIGPSRVPFVRVYRDNYAGVGSRYVNVESSASAIAPGAWAHIFFTYEEDTAARTFTLKLFVNGKLVASTSQSGVLAQTSNESLEICGTQCQGDVDDVEMWSRALTEGEVQANYSRPNLQVDFGTLSDTSSLANTVTCDDSAIPGESGAVSCPEANGSGGTFAQQQYLTVSGGATSLGSSGFTFSTWMRPEARTYTFDANASGLITDSFGTRDDTDWQGVFGAYVDHTTDPTQERDVDVDVYPSLFVSDDGRLRMEMGTAAAGADHLCQRTTPSGLVDFDQWQYVTVSYDGNFTFYIDGQRVYTATSCAGVEMPSVSSFTIGRPNAKSYVFLDKLQLDKALETKNNELIKMRINANSDNSRGNIWKDNDLDPDRWDPPKTRQINVAHPFDGSDVWFRLWENDQQPGGAFNGDDDNVELFDFFDSQRKLGAHDTNFNKNNSGEEVKGELFWTLSNDYFTGSLEDFRLYGFGMGDDDVRTLYASTRTALDLDFDEPPGIRSFGDSSGNVLFATCASRADCPDSGIPGRDNQAVRFDGGAPDEDGYDGVADGLTLSTTPAGMGLLWTDDSSVGPKHVIASFTVQTWVKADEVSGSRTILGWDNGTAPPLEFGLRGGRPAMWVAGMLFDTPAASAIGTDDWHHVAWAVQSHGIRYTSSACGNNVDTSTMADRREWKTDIYVDGQLASESLVCPRVSFAVVDNAFEALASSSVPLRIGRGVGLSTDYDGLLDELSVVRRGLSQADVGSWIARAPVLNLHLDEDTVDAGSFADDTPLANDATCTTCPAAGSKGQVREAAVFDGADDALVVADDPSYDLDTFTIALWLRPREGRSNCAGLCAGREPILAKRGLGDGSQDNYSLELNPDRSVRFRMREGCTTTRSFVSSGKLTPHQWNQVVATFDGETMRLYLNGSLDPNTETAGGTCQNDEAIVLGGDGGSYNAGVLDAFRGEMDEVTIHGGALSAAEVRDVYDYQASWYDTTVQQLVTIDAVAPDVSFASNELYLTNNPTWIAVQVVDPDSGVSDVSFSYSGPSSDSGTATADGEAWLVPFTPNGEGTYQLGVVGTDNVGNTSPAAQLLLHVDDTPPVATLSLPPIQPSTTITDAYHLDGTIQDDDGDPSSSGVAADQTVVDVIDHDGVSARGAQYVEPGDGTWSVEYPFDLPPYGLYDVAIRARDVAGNSISTTLATVPLDGYGPVGDVTLGTDTVIKPTGFVRGTASDLPEPIGALALMLHAEEADGATQFLDGSRNQLVATCTSCPSGVSDGVEGRALAFDGMNDGLTIAEDERLEPDAMTLSAWLRVAPPADPKPFRLIAGIGDASGQRFMLGLNELAGQVVISTTTAAQIATQAAPVSVPGQTSLNVAAPTSLPTGSWFHLAVSYEDGLWSVFIDGILAGTVELPIGDASGLPLRIGGTPGVPSFDGAMDEFALYNEALEPEAIYDLAHALGNTVASAEIRFRSYDEADIGEDDGTWSALSLVPVGPDAATWAFPWPAGIQGDYRIDLRLTDSVGNVRFLPAAWLGTIIDGDGLSLNLRPLYASGAGDWAPPPDTAYAGTPISFEVGIHNADPFTFHDVITTVYLPSHVAYLTSTDSCVVTAGTPDTGQTLTCSLGDVEGYGSASFQIMTRILPTAVRDDADGKAVKVVSASVTSVDPDANLDNNVDEASFFVTDLADLRIAELVEPAGSVRAGEQLTYTILVDNLGPSSARNVVITDTLVTSGFVDANGCSLAVRTAGGLTGEFDCNFALATGVFDLATMGSNWLNPRSLTDMGRILITINATANEGLDLDNVSTVTADTPDPDLGNNIATVLLSIESTADLAISDPDSPDPVVAGSALGYTVRITNTGPSTAENVVVEDLLPPEVDVVSVTASSGSCNAGTPGDPFDPTTCTFGSLPSGASRTIQISTLVHPDAVTDNVSDQKIIHNDVRVTSDTLDSNLRNNLDTEATTVLAQADLALSKFGVGTPRAGGLFSYEYDITNLGPSVSRDVSLRDFLPDEVEFLSAYTDAEGAAGGVPQACAFAVGTHVLVCPLGDVPPTDGVPILVFVNVRIRSDVPGGTVITNNADVNLTDTPDPDAANNSASTSVTVLSVADLSIAKTAEPQKVNAGEQEKFTITVTNHGPSDAQNVMVTDTLPVGLTYEVDTDNCTAVGQDLTCTGGRLPAGQTWQFDVWAVVDPATPGGTTLTNSACVAGETTLGDPDAANNCASADVFVEQEADLRIVKTVSPHNPVRAGQQFTYTIIVDNLGPSRADNIVITDTLIASGLVRANGCSLAVRTASGLTDEFDCNFALATGVFDLATMGSNWLNPRSPTDMGRIIITINATADEAMDLTNVTTVTSDAYDPDMSNNIAITVSSVTAVSDVEVTETAAGQVIVPACPPGLNASGTHVTAGTNMTYIVTVTNHGPSRAENVTLYDRMPPGVQILSATPSTGSCSTGTPGNPADRLICGLGTMTGGGGSASVTIVAQAAWNLPDGMVLENDAFVASDSFDADNGNNYAYANLTVNRQADLAVTKTDNPDPVVAGELLEYTVTVANNGPSVATDVAVIDTLDPNVTFQNVRDPFDAGVSCTLNPIDDHTLSCSLPDIVPGDQVVFTIVVQVNPDAPVALNNHVEAASDTADPCDDNNRFDEGTSADREEQLAVHKTDNPDPVIAGTELTYDVDFRNNGPSTATSTRVDDTLPLGVIFSRCEELDPNEAVTCQVVSGDGMNTPQVVRLIEILHSNVVVYTDGGNIDPGEHYMFRIVTDVSSGYVLDGRGDTGPGDACESFFLASGYQAYAHNQVDFTANEGADRDDECTRVNSLADLQLDLAIVPPGGALALSVGPATAVSAVPATGGVSTGVDASNGVATSPPTGLLSRFRRGLVGLVSRASRGAAQREGSTAIDLSAPAAAGQSAASDSAAPTASALPFQVLADCGATSPGEDVTWRATITNNGPSDAADVQFTAKLPPGVVHDPAVVVVDVSGDLVDAPPFIEVRDDGLITVTLCRLNAAGLVTIDIATTVRQDATGNQRLDAQVFTVVDDRCPDRFGRPTPDPILENNFASLGFIATQASVNVKKTVSFTGQCPGQSGRVTALTGQDATYCLEITNTGDTYLDQINVVDTLTTRLGVRTVFTDIITSGADPLVPVAPGETVTRSYTIDPLLGEECGIATNTVSVSGIPTNAGRTTLQCVVTPSDTDSVRVDVPCAGVDFRLQLPTLDNEACETWVQVQNVGEVATKAVLVIWGDPGFCPPQASGPLKVECSGLLRPGSAWSFSPSLLPTGAKSAIAYSANAVDRVPDLDGNLRPFADVVCSTLFRFVVGDHDRWVAFDDAFRHQAVYHSPYDRSGLHRVDLDFSAHPGEPLAITVDRQCPDPTDPNVSVNAAYTAVSSDEEGARDPRFGGYTYYAPLILANNGGLNSSLWIQNSGDECTSLEIWFKAQDDCLRPILGDVLTVAPGESVNFDPNTVVGPDWQGSAWIRGSQPLGVVVDTMGANHFTSYKGVTGDVDSLDFSLGTQVNFAPLVYNQQQGWDTLIQVQNLSSTTNAKVKVYFLDRSGDIVTTLVDWICPRGSQSFFLPVIGGIPGNWVGSVRVESQEWWSPGDPLVDSPRIQSVAILEKWDDPARTMRREAMAYNAFTERTSLDWQLGRGDGSDGSAVLAVPLLAKDNRGINSELGITNLVPKPGFTDFAVFLYDQNGLVDYVCEKLNEYQVEYIDLSQWGFIAPRWLGSAVISATFWEHDVFDDQGQFLRNYVGLGAVAVERIGGTMADGDIPGDESKAFEAFPVFDFFLNEGAIACPGTP